MADGKLDVRGSALGADAVVSGNAANVVVPATLPGDKRLDTRILLP